MPRPKKQDLSPAVGKANPLRKRGNPDFVGSSFYVPKKVNIEFDQALLTVKAAGHDVDRSDILTLLMSRFVKAVNTARERGDDSMDAQSLMESGATNTALVTESASISWLKFNIETQVHHEEERRRILEQEHAEEIAALEKREKLLMGLLQQATDTHHLLSERLQRLLADPTNPEAVKAAQDAIQQHPAPSSAPAALAQAQQQELDGDPTAPLR